MTLLIGGASSLPFTLSISSSTCLIAPTISKKCSDSLAAPMLGYRRAVAASEANDLFHTLVGRIIITECMGWSPR